MGKNQRNNSRGRGRNSNKEERNSQDNAEMREYNKGRRAGVASIETGNTKDNDPSWYGAYPQLVKDAANIPFPQMAGKPVRYRTIDTSKWNGSSDALNAYYVPSQVFVARWVPSIGSTSGNPSTDAVNIAANALYTYVRHENSGRTNYDASDLMLYVLAMTDVYSYYAWLTRVYGVMMNYSNRSVVTPSLLIQGMGVDYDDVANHLADFRLGINVLAKKLSSRCVPNSMTYSIRHIWMNQNIYKDGNTEKAQYYMYNQAAYLKFGLGVDTGAGCLTLVAPNDRFIGDAGAALTVNDMLEFGNQLVEPIMAQEDFGIMSGDILKAFGEGNLIQVNPISETFQIVPAYSEEVLSQFENMNCTGIGGIMVPFGGISQNVNVGLSSLNNNIYLSAPDVITGAATAFTNGVGLGLTDDKFLVNFHKENITPDDVMVATRMTCLDLQQVNSSTSADFPIDQAQHIRFGYKVRYNFNYAASGTEIPIQIQLYSYSQTGPITLGRVTEGYDYYAQSVLGQDKVLTVQDMLSRVESQRAVTNFDWHPNFRNVPFSIVTDESAGTTVAQLLTSRYPNQDLEWFTTVDVETLVNMNNVAILSELQCRNMGGFNLK